MDKVNRTEMLNQIKEAFNIRTNSELAKMLGITNQAVTNWIARNTFDIELIYDKLNNLSPHWLLTGEGSMLKEPKIENREIVSTNSIIGNHIQNNTGNISIDSGNEKLDKILSSYNEVLEVLINSQEQLALNQKYTQELLEIIKKMK